MLAVRYLGRENNPPPLACRREIFSIRGCVHGESRVVSIEHQARHFPGLPWHAVRYARARARRELWVSVKANGHMRFPLADRLNISRPYPWRRWGQHQVKGIAELILIC